MGGGGGGGEKRGRDRGWGEEGGKRGSVMDIG